MFGFGFRQGRPRELVTIEEGFPFGGFALARALSDHVESRDRKGIAQILKSWSMS